MTEPSKRNVSQTPETHTRRRQYTKPKLTEYGSVAKLTQGTATKQSDGGGGGFRRMGCL